MKNFTLSLATVVAMSTFAIAGGDIAPVEPQITVPEVIESTPSNFYVGLGYSYFTGDVEGDDLEAHGMLALAGYKINEYFAIEGRYTGTLSDLTVDDVDYDKLMTNKALYLKPMYPVEDFTVYGLLGYGQTVANNTSDEGFQYGAGASFNAMENVDLFVDYTRLYDDSGLNAGDITVDTVNVGVTYSF